MTKLVPSNQRHSELVAVLQRVDHEGVMDIDARKEASYAKQLVGRRFAVVDDGGSVVGYLSGRYSGGRAPSSDLASEGVVAFVALIVIDMGARGEGHAFKAIQQFAARAREEKGATLITLNLDQSGDVDDRRASFARMGFAFEDALGAMAVGDLLKD